MDSQHQKLDFSAGLDPEIQKKALPSLSDKEVWDSFKDGNESSFIHIYQTYFNVLYAYGRKFCKNEELIKDSIQDLFIYLRRNRPNFGETDSIKFYLYKALKRRIVKEESSWYNRLEEEKEGEHYFEFTFSHEYYLIEREIDSASKERLNDSIKKLSPRKKEVIYYFFYEGMSYSQIQEIMGLENVKSARNLLYQALDFLRENIQPK